MNIPTPFKEHYRAVETDKLTRYKTIELAAQALVRNERDLSIVSLRQDLMDDLKKALAT